MRCRFTQSCLHSANIIPNDYPNARRLRSREGRPIDIKLKPWRLWWCSLGFISVHNWFLLEIGHLELIQEEVSFLHYGRALLPCLTQPNLVSIKPQTPCHHDHQLQHPNPTLNIRCQSKSANLGKTNMWASKGIPVRFQTSRVFSQWQKRRPSLLASIPHASHTRSSRTCLWHLLAFFGKMFILACHAKDFTFFGMLSLQIFFQNSLLF